MKIAKRLGRMLPWFACFSVSVYSCSPTGPSSAGHARPVAGARQTLEQHHWNITLKDHSVLDFVGFVLVRKTMKDRVLVVRPPSGEYQVPLADVVVGHIAGGRHVSYIPDSCSDPTTCPGGGDPFPEDSCDPGTTFCCPVRGGNGLSYPCNGPPLVVGGVGCFEDQPCGTDDNGNATGMGYFPFPDEYCWYDFQTDGASCYANPPPSPSAGPPKDLYQGWVLRLGLDATLFCSPDGKSGWAFARYEDPKNHGASVIPKLKHFISVGNFTLAYPYDIPRFNKPPPGSIDPSEQARIESIEWTSIIPITQAGSQIGFCNTP
jgi:hypothetical protein